MKKVNITTLCLSSSIFLIDLIYDNSMLAVEFGPEDGISEDEFKVSIENAFSKFKIF